MDGNIREKISEEWNLPPESIEQGISFFGEIIKPVIKTKYLSHLVATIEDMINDKRLPLFIKTLKEKGTEPHLLGSFLATRTLRLYSIVLAPTPSLKKRATVRHHNYGAVIYYSSNYDETTTRILIAHELGHIVNKELRENIKDSEQMANLFAYIAIEDKDLFYSGECKRFITVSDIQLFNNITTICPTSKDSN